MCSNINLVILIRHSFGIYWLLCQQSPQHASVLTVYSNLPIIINISLTSVTVLGLSTTWITSHTLRKLTLVGALREQENVHPCNRERKSIEPECPARLYGFTLVHWYKVGWGPDGSWGTVLQPAGAQTLPVAERWLVIECISHSRNPGLNAGEIFFHLPQMCDYLGSNSALVAPGPKPAGGGAGVASTTHLLGGSERLNHRLRNEWYGESVQLLPLNERRLWGSMCFLSEDTEASLGSLSKVTVQLQVASLACRHVLRYQSGSGWLLWLFFMK